MTNSIEREGENMKFNIEDDVVINENAQRDLPDSIGKYGYVATLLKNSPNFDYEVDIGMTIEKVKEKELSRITDFKLELAKVGDKVLYTNTHEFAVVEQIDEIYNQVSIKFKDGGVKLAVEDQLKLIMNEEDLQIEQAKEVSKPNAKSEKDDVANRVSNAFLKQYRNSDNTYTLPEEVLHNILNTLLEEVTE